MTPIVIKSHETTSHTPGKAQNTSQTDNKLFECKIIHMIYTMPCTVYEVTPTIYLAIPL